MKKVKEGKKSRVQRRDVEKGELYLYAVVREAARAGPISNDNSAPYFPIREVTTSCGHNSVFKLTFKKVKLE